MQIFTYENNEDVRELVDKFQFKDEFKDVEILCDYYETRNSWGHKGCVRTHDLHFHITDGRIRYWNRTWECYTYQSLLRYLVRKAMTEFSKIDYNHVYSLSEQELDDFKNLKRLEFLDKYGWCGAKGYRETKKHLQRIGEI